MRRLVINADDFGLTSGVNHAIAEIHRTGMLTSATLMATGNRFDEAIQTARACPKLSIGCHVVLVDGSPVSASQQIASLMSNKKGRAHLRERLSSFAASAIAGGIKPADVETEAAAQIRKLQEAGIDVTHVDTHKHTHMFPSILGPLLRAARACGVRAVRNPFVAVTPFALAQLRNRTAFTSRHLQVRVLRSIWAKQFRGLVEASGLATTDGCFGVTETGYWDSESLPRMIASIPDGTWEFVCHPGYVDAELDGIRTRLRQSRAQEMELLLSPVTRDLISRQKIKLISFRDLPAQSG